MDNFNPFKDPVILLTLAVAVIIAFAAPFFIEKILGIQPVAGLRPE